jgi:glycosyltransferase involved in cell wall biosynthesis
MRVLFVHKHCPGQFVHLARALAADRANEVVFIAAEIDAPVTGVRTIRAQPTRRSGPPTHHYLQSFENAVLLGQAAYRACAALRKSGFAPDLIYAHAGFGPGLYLKEAFPDATLIGYFEWFYRPHASDADFLAPYAVSDDEALRIRTRNAALLMELAQCDHAIAPTRFQADQFPPAFRAKMTVLHDGIDTGLLTPGCRGRLQAAPFASHPPPEIVTYAARGLEPYRGFPQFVRALALLQKRREGMQAIVLGGDGVHYGRPREDGHSWKDAVLAENPTLDPGRVHFLGTVDHARFRAVLRASHAHVYLTVPFVPSWSLLEAMACGCTVVGSDTPPVQEMIRHGETGLLADFHDPAAIADRIEEALDRPERAIALGAAARRHVVQTYDRDRMVARHLDLARALTAAAAEPRAFAAAE